MTTTPSTTRLAFIETAPINNISWTSLFQEMRDAPIHKVMPLIQFRTRCLMFSARACCNANCRVPYNYYQLGTRTVQITSPQEQIFVVVILQGHLAKQRNSMLEFS